MTGLLGAILLSTSCLVSPSSDNDSDNANRQALYDGGIAYVEFLADAERRKERWHRNSETATVDDDLLVRVRAVAGTWKILVVAVDGCSDSVSTIPYLARLVESVDSLDMRIVDSTVGRQVMLDHPTPDGRASTPTVVLLNEDYEEVGCFIERPAILQEWASENREVLDDDEYLKQKFAWYDEDAGRHTIEAMVELIEAAAMGKMGC